MSVDREKFLHFSTTLFFSLILVDSIVSPMAIFTTEINTFIPPSIRLMVPHFFKLIFLGQIFIFVFNSVFFLRTDFNKWTGIFIAMFLIGCLGGITFNQMDGYFLRHLYGWVVAFFGFSFGAKSSHLIENIIKKHIRVIYVFFTILILELLVYFVSYKYGILSYFGMSTLISYYSLLFFSKNHYLLFLISIVGAVLSGKRVVIVGVAAVVGLVFTARGVCIESTFANVKRRPLFSFLFLVGFLVSLYMASKFGAFSRLQLIFNPDSYASVRSLYIVTSGRSAEFIAQLKGLLLSPMSFFLGGGWGTYFVEHLGELGERGAWYKHYSHFSPFYMVLVYGVPFTIFIYVNFISLFWSKISKHNSFVFQVAFFGFITSFFGSTVYVDPKFWFFLGALFASKKTI